MAQSNYNGLGAIRHTQFSKDGAGVIAHRSFREIQLMSNISIGKPAHQQLQDFTFTIAQVENADRFLGR